MIGTPLVIFKYGLFANLPVESSAEGTFYVCTDTFQLFLDTGTAISEVFGGSGGGDVESVAGRTGVVVLGESDITGLVASLAALATSSALTTETSRAEAAESTNATAISTETTRAEAAEATKASTTALTAETTRAEAAEALLVPLSSVGANNGVASLNSSGQVPSSQIPALAITETYVVASQVAMLALAASVGDIAVRSDISESFVLQTAGASTLSNWVQLLSPPNAVLSVNGQTGVVSLTASEVGADASGAAATETTRAEAAEALLVPQTTTVNTHALSGNVVVSASDLTTGTLPHARLPALVSGDIPNNAANTSGTAAGLSGTPALPSGTTATTQAPGDSSTDVANDTFVAAAVAAATALINTAPDYYLLPYGNASLYAETVTGVLAQYYGYIGMVQIPAIITFTQMSAYVYASSNGNNLYLGIYNLAGTLVASVKIALSAATGLYRATLLQITGGVTSVTLPPGSYWLMFGSDNASAAVNLYGSGESATYINGFINVNQVRRGYRANQIGSGAITGTITPSGFTKNAQSQPYILLEP